jgi:teichuronic acid biosynthesis glycosyltransferase TuaC
MPWRDNMYFDLIVLSGMFPRKYSPHSGTFVYEQVKALTKLIKGSITVIVPVPWSPRLLWFRKKWREYGKTERVAVIDNITIYYTRHLLLPGRLFFPIQGLSIYWSVKSLVRKLIKDNGKRTILHSHAILPSGLAGVLLARKFRIPHTCTVHGSDINIYPYFSTLSFLLTKYALKRCDHIVAVSNKIKEKTLSVERGIRSLSVIHNGADSKHFLQMSKETAKQKLGINDNRKIIMYIGNLVPVKGVSYLIEAFGSLLTDYTNKNVVLFLIGDGNEREKLLSLARRLRAEENVFFWGRKPHSEIPLWLNIADVLVLPSVSEGFPTIIPEAHMSGIPVVASDVGGISDIIIDRVTGMLVKSRDVEGLRKAIKLMLNNKTAREGIIAVAKEKSKNYTWENNALSAMRIYADNLSI